MQCSLICDSVCPCCNAGKTYKYQGNWLCRKCSHQWPAKTSLDYLRDSFTSIQPIKSI